MGVEHPDWLPVGWKVIVKVRGCGRKDKYYFNPSNGLKFNSKLEVLRYLKSSGKDRKKDLNKIHIKKTVAEKLPPGWIKEIRTKKKGGKTRRDPYYIDPDSGRYFRSMQEVFRYLESKDSGKLKSKPNDKGQKLASVLKDAATNNVNMAEGSHLEQREEDNSVANELSDKLQLVNRVEQRADRTREIKREKVVKQRERENDSVKRKKKRKRGRRQSKRLADIEPKDNVTKVQSLKSEKNINTTETNRQHENLVHPKKRKSLWTSDLPRRTSQRLARMEVDPTVEVKTSKKPVAEVNTTKTLEPETDSTGKFSRFNDPNEHSSQCRTEDQTNSKQKNTITNGNLSSAEDERQEKQADSSLKDILMDPCIEFAIKTLTGAIPIEDKLASPNQASASSSGDIWADPCFEFAVKTLTGEMPMENGSQFQISFQQPVSSSGVSGCNGLTLSKIRLDNFYASDYTISQFDAAKKSLAINDSSQRFVGTSFHHGDGGKTGNFM